MRYVNYRGDPVDVPTGSTPQELAARTPGAMVIRHVKPERSTAPGIIDYTGLERTVVLDEVEPQEDGGRLRFSVDGATVTAEYVVLERLGKVHYKITSLESLGAQDPDEDEEELMALLEQEANRQAPWLDSVPTDPGSDPEVQYWDQQFTEDGSCQLVFLVNGREVVTESETAMVAGEPHPLPTRILGDANDLPAPTADLLLRMRESVIEQVTAQSSSPWDDTTDPPF